MNHHGVEGIAESEAASHAVSVVRKQREMTAAAELLFSSSFSQGPTLWLFPPQVVLWKCPHRYALQWLSQMSPNMVKLAMKMGLHSCKGAKVLIA